MRILFVITVLFLASSLTVEAKKGATTRDENKGLFVLRESVAARIERSITNVQDVLNNIQNSIVNITIENNQAQQDSCNKLHEKLNGIKDLLIHIYELLLIEKQLIGNFDDSSVDSDNFTSADDIDSAELTIISWLKSIYRRQLEDDFIIS